MIGLSLCQIGTKDEKVGWGWDNGYDYETAVLIRLPLRPTAASFSTYYFSMVFLWFLYGSSLFISLKIFLNIFLRES